MNEKQILDSIKKSIDQAPIDILDRIKEEPKEDLWQEYRIVTCEVEEVVDVDAIIFAVSHDEFKTIKLEELKKMYRDSKVIHSDWMEEAAVTVECHKNNNNDNKGHVLIDVKGIFDRHEAEVMGYLYWRL